MNNPFTELAQSFDGKAESANQFCDRSAYSMGQREAYSNCACDLESLIAEHMTWVQITDNPDTWPTVGMCFFADLGLGGAWMFRIDKTKFDGEPNFCVGEWYRPLNDNDYPPQEVK